MITSTVGAIGHLWMNNTKASAGEGDGRLRPRLVQSTLPQSINIPKLRILQGYTRKPTTAITDPLYRPYLCIFHRVF